MAWFYEIRTLDNAVLKREGGFASRDSAKTAAREDAKVMKDCRRDVTVACEALRLGSKRPFEC